MFFSCGRELGYDTPNPDQKEQLTRQALTVKATIGETEEAKTAVQPDGASIYWTPGDAINLFYGTVSSGQFTTAIEAPALTTDFNGTLSVATGTSTENGVTTQSFWGVYPYNASNSCTGDGVILTIPSSQSGIAGSFADKLNPSVATSPGLSLAFYNVGSWFIFSVTEPDIVSATLTGHNNENLAGRVKVTMDAETHRPVAEVLDGQKSITMTPEGGSFEVGESYYMVVIPGRMSSGLELTLTKSNGKQATWSISNDVTFTRSQYLRKLNADNGLTYQLIGNISFADNTVKAICVEHWDSNGDGELSYDEAAAVTSLSTHFRRNTSIRSFNELVYFEGLTSIDLGAFAVCTSLEEITLPISITSIGQSAFSGCTSLKTVKHQGGGISIGTSAFYRCINLENFSFDGISVLGSDSFGDCTSLGTVINIPASVQLIWEQPFRGCTQITRFTGPHTDSDGQILFHIIHDDNFNVDTRYLGQVLPSIVNFTLPAGNYYLNCPLGETSAKTITIPSTAEIGYGCTITIPENVETLTFEDGFSFNYSFNIAALPVGCEIYSEFASADHSSLIVNNIVIAFSYPRANWDNQQCYRLPAGVKFGAKVKLNSGSDQSLYCWGLVFPSTVTFYNLGMISYSLGGDVSYIFESGSTAFSVLESIYNDVSDYFRVIIPEASYDETPGGYYYRGRNIMVCPYHGSAPSTGQQMQWWPIECYYSL